MVPPGWPPSKTAQTPLVQQECVPVWSERPLGDPPGPQLPLTAQGPSSSLGGFPGPGIGSHCPQSQAQPLGLVLGAGSPVQASPPMHMVLSDHKPIRVWGSGWALCTSLPAVFTAMVGCQAPVWPWARVCSCSLARLGLLAPHTLRSRGTTSLGSVPSAHCRLWAAVLASAKAQPLCTLFLSWISPFPKQELGKNDLSFQERPLVPGPDLALGAL